MKEKQFCAPPNVLRIRIKKSAKTCRGVLYDCLAPVLPHCGRCDSSCLRDSSAFNTEVGTSAHVAGRSSGVVSPSPLAFIALGCLSPRTTACCMVFQIMIDRQERSSLRLVHLLRPEINVKGGVGVSRLMTFPAILLHGCLAAQPALLVVVIFGSSRNGFPIHNGKPRVELHSIQNCPFV